MNPYLVFVLVVLIGVWLLDLVSETLNLRAAGGDLPAEFRDVWDEEDYRRSQRYLRETTRLGLHSGTAQTVLVLVLIFAGGFDWFDALARRWMDGEILRGLIFVGLVMLAAVAVAQPFRLYRTFVIEEKYGFNRTTAKTYMLDLLKGAALAVALGGVVLAAVIWFFQVAGDWAWLIAWAAVVVFQVIVMYLAPILIMPLFNKFTPIADDELRAKIEAYAESQGFEVSGIYSMDASKRTTKGNAFFTGFGKVRRVVFFDTLLSDGDQQGLLNILAHEIGHCKHKDTLKLLAMSIVSTGIMFFALDLFLRNDRLFDAFGMTREPTIYASLVFIAFLLQPISLLLGIVTNAWSRRFEYAADAFAIRTCGPASAMITIMKRLTAKNLGNLTPHRLKVILDYSHPPILHRLHAMRELED